VTRTSLLLTAAALAAAVGLAACANATSSVPPVEPGASDPGFTVKVPARWEPTDDTDPFGYGWVGQVRDDGTRLGLSVKVRCLEVAFAVAADRLMSPEGNWADFQLVGDPEDVHVAGAVEAVRWHGQYTLPDPQNEGERARLYVDQLLASADDGTAVLVTFEGRDLWFDPELARTTLDSVTIAPTGC
jgi:hypothetical protein